MSQKFSVLIGRDGLSLLLDVNKEASRCSCSWQLACDYKGNTPQRQPDTLDSLV